MRAGRMLVALAVVSTAVVLAFTGRWPWPRFEQERATPATPALVFHEFSDTLQRGETLTDVFDRQ
ncbi:MAG TPA: hypothetical protein VF187_09940, partial [Gemmatimonadales bacterium]